MIKILSGHHVQPQLGFRQTGAFFGQPMSDDRLLFAAWGLPLLTCLNNNRTGDVQCPNCCEPKFLVEDCDVNGKFILEFLYLPQSVEISDFCVRFCIRILIYIHFF